MHLQQKSLSERYKRKSIFLQKLVKIKKELRKKWLLFSIEWCSIIIITPVSYTHLTRGGRWAVLLGDGGWLSGNGAVFGGRAFRGGPQELCGLVWQKQRRAFQKKDGKARGRSWAYRDAVPGDALWRKDVYKRQSLKGCPPRAVDITAFLEKEWD